MHIVNALMWPFRVSTRLGRETHYHVLRAPPTAPIFILSRDGEYLHFMLDACLDDILAIPRTRSLKPASQTRLL